MRRSRRAWRTSWTSCSWAAFATGRRTNLAYSVDLVRGLDVYAVDLPGSDSTATGPVLLSSAQGDPVGWRG